MSTPIEDYAVIGDTQTAALVGRNGSLDWLCFPRFDSPACFAALLGEATHGRWLIAPVGDVHRVHREYRGSTLILHTEFESSEGVVRLIDFMPLSDHRQDIVRIVEGVRGRVEMRMELIVRFDYGATMPWVRRRDNALIASTGPYTLELQTQVPLRSEDMKTRAQFSVEENERISFMLNCRFSYDRITGAIEPNEALKSTEEQWSTWSNQCTYKGRWHDAVMRSLITLRCLTYTPTGGIVAAPTTSLPERAGGERNWDYRYCWLRDATFTLNAMLIAGYPEEGLAWCKWLEQTAGGPEELQVLYSVTGQRHLDERELDWLPGYQGAAPVRIGNAASEQLQLDVYGELADTLHLARVIGLTPDPQAWEMQLVLMRSLESRWRLPDEGIWEVRGPRRHFTHSKMLAWVAFDRSIKDAERFGLDAPLERWRAIRKEIHDQVCASGYDAARNTFVQSYGSPHLDASLLLMPQVGFLPPDDPRVRGTVDAIERHLVVNGLVLRYSTAAHVDSLPPGESAFLPCSFWLADSRVAVGRRSEGEALFEHLLELRNETGLLPEEYDPHEHRMYGNFPQALTHVALINTATLLSIPPEQAEQAYRTGERPAAAGLVANNQRGP